ncbi:TPA: hypothetical protein DCZ15_00795 [Candidatus Falkowbacteria bacterium]|nr:MAG: polymerase beta domain protein region protein [Candidatus Falkowbacteria bacterium GW2011_GWF2_43_32]HBA36392.1 hypothetical protein [Candidatus Falkowbacteria bacterium]
MLSALFGSAARVKILNLLLLHPEKRYLLRELAAELQVSPTAIVRELKNLTAIGLIGEERLFNGDTKETVKQRKKEKKYFRATESFILFPEIRALFIKAQILSSQKFLIGLQKICQPKFLALTGLFTNYPEAQTDILIVGTIRRQAFLKLIKELEKDLGREVNFTILTDQEFRYRRDIMDIFLYNILEGKTVVLLDNLHKKNL